MDTVMFTGSMPVEELKADKPALYEKLIAQGELEDHLVDAPSPTFVRAGKILGFCALTVGLLLVVLIIYAMLFSYR